MILKSWFTEGGTPKTGASPTITIHNTTDDVAVVTDAATVESGNGWYKYDFSAYDFTKEYDIIWDSGLTGRERYASESLPVDADEEVKKRLLYNKVTKSGDVITVYENDGSTIWKRFNLASGGRVEV